MEILISVLALVGLVALAALIFAFQASKRGVEANELATQALNKANQVANAPKKPSSLPPPANPPLPDFSKFALKANALEWDDVQPHLDKYYLTRDEIKAGYATVEILKRLCAGVANYGYVDSYAKETRLHVAKVLRGMLDELRAHRRNAVQAQEHALRTQINAIKAEIEKELGSPGKALNDANERIATLEATPMSDNPDDDQLSIEADMYVEELVSKTGPMDAMTKTAKKLEYMQERPHLKQKHDRDLASARKTAQRAQARVDELEASQAIQSRREAIRALQTDLHALSTGMKEFDRMATLIKELAEFSAPSHHGESTESDPEGKKVTLIADSEEPSTEHFQDFSENSPDVEEVTE